ncbi:MAG TPA: hypothetical protein PKE66_15750 [Pyrinomonadaceae bacterium]|nr:hypothetical protein [Pyrinomonadaceae bacterium]
MASGKPGAVQSKSDLIALDESDTAALITRRLVEEHPYFSKGKVVLAKYGSANLASNDLEHFITIIKLYDFVGYMLRYVLYNFDRTTRVTLKYVRPSDDKLDEYYLSICGFFENFIGNIPSLKSYFEAKPAEQIKVLKSERQTKLNMLYRSVGLEIFLRTINQIVASGKTVDEAIAQVTRLPVSFKSKLYADLLYDVGGERIIPGRVRITRKLPLTS